MIILMELTWLFCLCIVFFFKQKTAYEMRISDWSSDVCSSDLAAEGIRSVGVEAIVKRVPETTPEEIAQKNGFKLDQKAPIATVDELAEYDGIILGFPTRFGTMPAQMKAYLDQTGGIWSERKLVGQVGSILTSSGTQHGGPESTILGRNPVLIHHCMIFVGLP